MFLPMWVIREKAEKKWGERQVDVSAHVGYQRESREKVGRETGRCFCPCGLPEKKQGTSGERERKMFLPMWVIREKAEWKWGERDR